MLRLNSFLAKAGIAARRKSTELIEQGLVTVNDVVVLEPGFSVDPDVDIVLYKTREVSLRKNFHYIMVNKPKGFVSTAKDNEKRKTVMDLIDTDRRIYPVGRLDMNTKGLLLLTDDGELCNILTHPKFVIDKIYQAEIHRPPYPDELKRLNGRLDLGHGEFVKAKVEVVSTKKSKKNVLQFTIHSGKKHVIKRMAAAVNLKVVNLTRSKFAGFDLGTLPLGYWRFLSKTEIQTLYKLAGLER